MSPTSQNPLAPALAALGALLLFISLLLNWFSLDVKAQGQELSVGIARPDTAVLLLVILAGGAGLIAAGRFRGTVSGKSELIAGLGAIAFIYVLVNFFKKPQLLDLIQSGFDEAQERAGQQISEAGADFGIGLGPGLWIALVGSLLLLGAGLWEVLGAGGGARGGLAAGAQPGVGAPGAGPTPPPGASTPTPSPTQTVGAPAPPDRSAGWKPDPYGQAQMRYWDGASWTEHTN
jgi:hypothetical protein